MDNYWEKQGWGDGWNCAKPKTLGFFQGAQIQHCYDRYMSGYRAGKQQRIDSAGTPALRACLPENWT